MSNCIVTININNKELKVNLKDSSPSVLIDQDFIEALREQPELVSTLVDNLREMSLNTGLKSITLKDLQSDGIQANCTLQYLRENPKYSEITFPDGNANILLVKKLVLGGTSISGRIINSNGEEIFVTNGSESDLKKLASFLKVRNKIRDQGMNLSEDSPHYPELKEILELKNAKLKKKLDSIEDLILDYIYNKKSYAGLSLKNGKSIISVLEPFIRNIQKWETPSIFDDPFITDINLQKANFGYSTKEKINTSFIHYDVLFKLLKKYYQPLLDAFNINSKNFKETEKNKDFLEIFTKYDNNSVDIVKDSNNLLEAIIKYTFSTEPEFDFSFYKTSKKGIFLKQGYTPISEKYGIAYDTIQEMKRTSYKGYFIYEQTLTNNHKRVFASRGTLTEENKSKPYKSVEEAQQEIDKILAKQFLRKNSLIEFKYRDSAIDENGKTIWDNSLPKETIESTVYFPVGTIVESINIPINKKTNIRGDEQALLNKANIKSFQELINSWTINNKHKEYILQNLDTPEKIITFIYKINEILGVEDRSKSKQMADIAKSIVTANKNYYYIEKRYSTGSTYTYKVIPTELDSMSKPDTPKNLPVITWMGAISQALNNQFGIQVNLLTSEEVSSQMKNVADPNLDKAFIYNGQVYINTTIASTEDLLHEHVHLILGILKSNPNLRANYERLLNQVISTKQGNTMLAKLSENYSGLSQMDLREEVFAKLFSNYLRQDITIQTKQVFEAAEEDIKEVTKTIFNTNISSIADFYGKTTLSIFKKFNSDVAKMLSSNNIDFNSTVESRQISNWVSKQINDGNIKEEC